MVGPPLLASPPIGPPGGWSPGGSPRRSPQCRARDKSSHCSLPSGPVVVPLAGPPMSRAACRRRGHLNLGRRASRPLALAPHPRACHLVATARRIAVRRALADWYSAFYGIELLLADLTLLLPISGISIRHEICERHCGHTTFLAEKPHVIRRRRSESISCYLRVTSCLSCCIALCSKPSSQARAVEATTLDASRQPAQRNKVEQRADWGETAERGKERGEGWVGR